MTKSLKNVKNEKCTLFAFLRSLEPLFDETSRVFSVDGKKLDEVAVYED